VTFTWEVLLELRLISCWVDELDGEGSEDQVRLCPMGSGRWFAQKYQCTILTDGVQSNKKWFIVKKNYKIQSSPHNWELEGKKIAGHVNRSENLPLLELSLKRIRQLVLTMMKHKSNLPRKEFIFPKGRNTKNRWEIPWFRVLKTDESKERMVN
jgi:hypothetical protein